jgi:molybdenum cofactor guanylyltransferase
MGLDKSLLPVGGRPLIAHIADQLAFFAERLIGSNDPARYAFLSLPVVPDQEPGHGPLMGILSCVDRAAHDLCFVTGCDIPTLDRGFILELLALSDGYDIVIPRLADGKTEPLLAVYRKTVVPVARTIMARGGRRIVELLDELRVRFVVADSLTWYCNLNTLEDYRRWLAARRSGCGTAPV